MRELTSEEQRIALAVVHIFETAKPLGNPATVAVLRDKAGISYGINQFTHRSGSLHAVVSEYVSNPDAQYRDALKEYLPELRDKRAANILDVQQDVKLKDYLRKAGTTQEMLEAQTKVAFEMYLKPAIEIWQDLDFTTLLGFAVIYDSINQGGYARCRSGVSGRTEKEWIKNYLNARKAWLLGSRVREVRTSIYRVNFFLRCVEQDKWDLKLPFICNGYRLTKDILRVEADKEPEKVQDDVLEATEKEIAESNAPEVIKEKDKPTSDSSGTQPSVSDTSTSGEVKPDGTENSNSAKNETTPVIEVERKKISFFSWLTALIAQGVGYLMTLGISIAVFFEKVVSFAEARPIFVVCLTLIIVGVAYAHFAKNRSHEETMWEAKNTANPDTNNVKIVG